MRPAASGGAGEPSGETSSPPRRVAAGCRLCEPPFRPQIPFAGWGGRAGGASRQRDEAGGFDSSLRIAQRRLHGPQPPAPARNSPKARAAFRRPQPVRPLLTTPSHFPFSIFHFPFSTSHHPPSALPFSVFLSPFCIFRLFGAGFAVLIFACGFLIVNSILYLCKVIDT